MRRDKKRSCFHAHEWICITTWTQRVGSGKLPLRLPLKILLNICGCSPRRRGNHNKRGGGGVHISSHLYRQDLGRPFTNIYIICEGEPSLLPPCDHVWAKHFRSFNLSWIPPTDEISWGRGQECVYLARLWPPRIFRALNTKGANLQQFGPFEEAKLAPATRGVYSFRLRDKNLQRCCGVIGPERERARASRCGRGGEGSTRTNWPGRPGLRRGVITLLADRQTFHGLPRMEARVSSLLQCCVSHTHVVGVGLYRVDGRRRSFLERTQRTFSTSRSKFSGLKNKNVSVFF